MAHSVSHGPCPCFLDVDLFLFDKEFRGGVIWEFSLKPLMISFFVTVAFLEMRPARLSGTTL